MKANFVWIEPSQWDRGHLRRVLKACEGKRVLVVGDVGLDRYTIGVVERISPEAPVPVVWVESEELKLGLAANVADNVRTLGGTADLIGVVGPDRAAEDFGKLLKRTGIGATSLVVDRGRRTVLKERVVSDRQQLLRIDYETPHPISPEIEKRVLARVKAALRKTDIVILQDYAKGMIGRRLAQEIVALAKKAGKPVAIDPHAKTPSETYKNIPATIIKPNLKEASNLAGIDIRPGDEKSLTEAGFKILKITGVTYAVITRGKEGIAIFTRGSREVKLVPTYVREVYDVSGAGDTVISVLTLALSTGAPIEDACILANLAAGVEVGKRGTATVSPAEILRAMEFFGAVV